MIAKSASTPLFIYGTRHGTLYNLTPTNMPKNIPAIQLSYGDFHDHIETLQNLPEGMTLKKFLLFPENTLTYMTPYNFAKQDCMTGCQNNSKVKIKCNKGYTEVTAAMYDKLVSIIKPDMYVTLTQYPLLQKDHENQSNKSYKRAINKTKTYLEQSLNTNNQQNDEYKGGLRVAAVHGGKNLALLNRCLEQVLDHAIDALVVCDLCENQTIAEREEVYNTINKRLEQQYNRQDSYFHKKNKKLKLILAGYGKLEDIEHALKFGFEAFEINYPFTLTEKHLALIWNKQKSIYEPKEPVKKQDMKPLSQQCKCYACVHHTEAYIAHLIDCHELTAKVLLSIHNTHVYESWLQRKTKEIQKN